MEQKSEVARLLEEIRLSYEAAHRALNAPAITARHDFITKRMERMHTVHMQLQGLVGKDEAIKLIAETLEQAQE